MGAAIVVNGQSHTIVGVVPKRLAYPAGMQMWVPLVFTPEMRAVRGMHDFLVLARLKKGTTLAGARAQMNAISARLEATYPKDDKGWGAAVIPLHEDLVGDVRPALLVLLGAVGCVLLIACANVANLVLARTLGRRKEIAVRAALGASRARIVRQLFAETTILALAGGILGIAVAMAGVGLILSSFLGEHMPRASEIRVDAPVLAFTFGIALVTGMLAGMIPAWRSDARGPERGAQAGRPRGRRRGQPDRPQRARRRGSGPGARAARRRGPARAQPRPPPGRESRLRPAPRPERLRLAARRKVRDARSAQRRSSSARSSACGRCPASSPRAR